MADEDSFEITTTAQVERTYLVQGADEDQARKRLRTWLADPDMLKDGLVAEIPDRLKDTTPQRTKNVKKVTRPRVVKDDAAKEETA